ncbi:hypothetical protein Mth01_42420 [Sphaerimonospora thailandensis]|uniref:Uncharacterized protein n=1 Tax=Sphaerimonospora thailandensis TaxID=795644 RepID=A0A8J3W083_9ACTN|nr:hypothetical protein Mth01_42420 [Sphaerimonospora thailandensis]
MAYAEGHREDEGARQPRGELRTIDQDQFGARGGLSGWAGEARRGDQDATVAGVGVQGAEKIAYLGGADRFRPPLALDDEPLSGGCDGDDVDASVAAHLGMFMVLGGCAPRQS